jgi:HAD superfamily phosphoserine phosphatase-like hydrolase
VSLKKIRHSKGRVVLFDWDGTVVPDFTILPWVARLSEEGLVRYGTTDRIRKTFECYYKGRKSYEDLCRDTASIYARGIAGFHSADLSMAAEQFVRSQQSNLYPYAPALFRRLDKLDIRTIVVSGAPICVLQAFAKKHPIHEMFGLEIAIDGSGYFVPRIMQNGGLIAEKERFVRALASECRVIMAFGNSLSDTPLFSVAEHGIVINNPKCIFPDTIQSNLIRAAADEVEPLVDNMIERYEVESGHH